MSSPEAQSGSSSDSSEDEFDLGAAAATPVAPPKKEEVASPEPEGAAAGGDHSKLFSDDEGEEEDASGGDAKEGEADAEKHEAGKEKEMEDLFGSDYDSEEEEFKASGVKESPVRDEDRHTSAESFAADLAAHGVGAGGSGAANEVWVPKTPRAPSTAKYFITKMPNILRLVPSPYTKEAIEEEMRNPSDETLYRNYVRWRYARDEEGRVKLDPKTGRPQREANTKLVQWEDGTLTMFVGKESLHLTRQKLANSFLFVNEVSSDRPEFADHEEEDEMPPGQETVLECHGRLDDKFTIRPTTTASKSHKSLTMSMRAKHNKGVQKVKQYISELDGDREQEQRVKIEDEKLRLQNRKKARQSFEDDRGRASRMDAHFLEDGGGYDDYDDDEHVGAIKQQFGNRGNSRARKQQRRPAAPLRGGGFDDYSRDRERAREREADKSDSEREDDAAGGEGEDDEEEEEMVFRTHKKRRTVDEDSD